VKPRLHKPHGKNKFCGPTALSALTGISKDDIAAIVREYSGRRAVMGMHNHEAFEVVNQLKGSMGTMAIGKPGGRTTLAQWMAGRTDAQRAMLTLVNVTDHYVAVLGDNVVCSLQRGEKLNIASARCRNFRFVRAWHITLPAKVELPRALLAARKDRALLANRAKSDKAKVTALAGQLGIAIERDDWGSGDIRWILSCGDEALWHAKLDNDGLIADGESIEEVFYDAVMGGESIMHDWAEALDKLERIQREHFA